MLGKFCTSGHELNRFLPLFIIMHGIFCVNKVAARLLMSKYEIRIVH